MRTFCYSIRWQDIAHTCHAPAAGGNYPLYLAATDHVPTHPMCVDGMDVFMAESGTHATNHMHECPHEYKTMSDAEDCHSMVSCAGTCPCETTSTSTGEGGATHIDWTAGFSDATARSTTAAIGQTLRFEWPSQHNVILMASEAAFNDCDFAGSTNLGNTSAVDYTLTSLPAYFACSIGSHCAVGQKLAVTAA